MSDRWGERVFNKLLVGTPGDERNKLGWLLTWAAGGIIVILCALIGVWVGQGHAVAGTLGDFFGGMLNPILSFMAFSGVLYSIYLQRTDLRANQLEAQRQQFEATFFQMLDFQNSIIEGIDLRNSDKNETSRGRDCFEVFAREIVNRYHNTQGTAQNDIRRELAAAYRLFWERRRGDLGHYFRFLYNFIRYVDEADLTHLASDKVEPKTKYMRILRAQLSDYELVLIFYNSLGDYGLRFNEYVGRYHLLDNLQPELIKVVDAIEMREGLGRVGPLPERAAL